MSCAPIMCSSSCRKLVKSIKNNILWPQCFIWILSLFVFSFCLGLLRSFWFKPNIPNHSQYKISQFAKSLFYIAKLSIWLSKLSQSSVRDYPVFELCHLHYYHKCAFVNQFCKSQCTMYNILKEIVSQHKLKMNKMLSKRMHH